MNFYLLPDWRLNCTIVMRLCLWSVRPSLTFHIFKISSQTTKRNSMKLTRKQDPNVLYQVPVFQPLGKSRWSTRLLTGWDIFNFSSETAEQNLTKLDRKQDLNDLYQVCVFLVDRKTRWPVPASDWPRHFRIIIWNRWTEFTKTWQEVRSQCPLPSLCFFKPISKQKWPPWLINEKGGTLYSSALYVALWASCYYNII